VVNFRPHKKRSPIISTDTQQQEAFNTALRQLRTGDAAGAASTCSDALRIFPSDANFLCLAAKSNLVLKQFDEAKKQLDEAISLHPDFAIAHDVLGDLSLSQGYAETAVKAYEQALRLDPARPNLVTKIEKAQELLASAPKRQKRSHTDPPGRRMAFEDEIRQGEQFVKDGEPQKAEAIYRSILKRDPNHVEAARLLAGIAVKNDQLDDAEVFLRHAASVAPDYGRIWVDLTNVLRDQENLDDALACALEVLRLAPDKAESHVLYGSVIGAAGHHEDAISSFQKALAIAPEKAGVRCSMAHHMKTIGNQDEAIATYRQSISTKADNAEAYWSLANLKTFRFAEAEIAAMQSLLDDDDLPDESRVQIHNALGLDSEARHEYDGAFAHFEQSNLMRRKVEKYDPVENETGIDQCISVFNKDLFEKNAAAGNPDSAPIFIVGLPRSGSTLIEQILASHSMVDGTHELRDLTRAVKNVSKKAANRYRFPGGTPDLSTDQLSAIGQDYIASTKKYRSDAPRFIDKNPNNFLFVGLLRLVLPNAKIINARRHPLDSCFGTYKQLFAFGQPFSYDLTELGEYYVQYQRLLDHWHQQLPGFVLDVQYEDVVADLDTQVRRILDFCGLPFEESCLRFHETERAVKTASSEQVRRPIYSSSVNLWRNYETHLDELIHILKPLLSDLSEADQPAMLLSRQ